MFELFKRRRERLYNNFKQLQQEINDLRKKLNEVNNKKETFFKEKEDLKKQIAELIKKSKEFNIKIGSSGEKLEQLKQERDQYNREVGALIEKIRELNKQKEELFKKYNLRVSPSSIKMQIEKLEMKIETEAISFRKEQKIMKQIKSLKDSYNKSTEISQLIEKINSLSKEIELSKHKAQEIHKQIQVDSKENREKFYDDFIKTSKEITELRTRQESAFKRFLRLKRVFIETNNQLKEKLLYAAKLRHKLTRLNVDISKIDQNKERILEEKRKYAESKLKRGQKLTTEDLMAYQKGE